METQLNNPLPSVLIRKRKPNAMKGMKKAVCYVSAIVGFIVGFFLIFTLIGIPLTILMWIGSIGLIAAAGDKYQVTCPNCKKKTVVGKNQEDFECKRCHQPVIINWMEYK